jgi:hypothetical protein
MEHNRKFWETARPGIVHLDTDERMKKCHKSWKELWLSYILPIKGKSVVDYGTGAGWLGQLLFDEHNISRYIGVDIAQRQLDAAADTTKKWKEKTEFHILPYDLSESKADVLVCQAVMQHFFDVQMYDDFCGNVNNSNIPMVMLQWREKKGNKKVKFNIKGKKDHTVKKILRANYVNAKFIEMRLPNYRRVLLAPLTGKSSYRFALYSTKEKYSETRRSALYSKKEE